MIEKIKELLVKYREIIVYLIVGVLTTIVSWAGAWVAKLWLDSTIPWQDTVINTFSWVVGVVFAYPLNRKWVFNSTNPHIIKEFLGFSASRISTWIMDIVIMLITQQIFHIPYWIAKIFISAVLVTITNYVFSKLLIFKKKKDAEE